MKKFLLILMLVAANVFADQQYAQLTPVSEITLTGVDGPISHLALDAARQRLFVSATGSNLVEIIDLKSDAAQKGMVGVPQPKGIAFLYAVNRFAVASAGEHSLRIYDGNSFSLVSTLKDLGDVEDVVYNEKSNKIFVGAGKSILVVDASTLQSSAYINIGGHPVGLVVDPSGSTVYASCPSQHSVMVINVASQTVTSTWKTGSAEGVSLALDATDDHLWVASRRPPGLVALNASTGERSFSLAIGSDVGDVHYSPMLHRVMASCGSGAVNIYEWVNVESYKKQPSVKTGRGARASLMDDGMGMLFVAVPGGSGGEAKILLFALKPS